MDVPGILMLLSNALQHWVHEPMWLWHHAEDRLTQMQMTPPCHYQDGFFQYGGLPAGCHLQSEFPLLPLCIYKCDDLCPALLLLNHNPQEPGWNVRQVLFCNTNCGMLLSPQQRILWYSDNRIVVQLFLRKRILNKNVKKTKNNN